MFLCRRFHPMSHLRCLVSGKILLLIVLFACSRFNCPNLQADFLWAEMVRLSILHRQFFPGFSSCLRVLQHLYLDQASLGLSHSYMSTSGKANSKQTHFWKELGACCRNTTKHELLFVGVSEPFIILRTRMLGKQRDPLIDHLTLSSPRVLFCHLPLVGGWLTHCVSAGKIHLQVCTGKSTAERTGEITIIKKPLQRRHDFCWGWVCFCCSSCSQRFWSSDEYLYVINRC